MSASRTSLIFCASRLNAARNALPLTPHCSMRRYDPQHEPNISSNKRRVPTVSVLYNSDNSNVLDCFFNDANHQAEDCTSLVSETIRRIFSDAMENAFIARCEDTELQTVAGELFVVNATDATLHHSASRCVLSSQCLRYPVHVLHEHTMLKTHREIPPPMRPSFCRHFESRPSTRKKRSFLRGLIYCGTRQSFI